MYVNDSYVMARMSIYKSCLIIEVTLWLWRRLFLTKEFFKNQKKKKRIDFLYNHQQAKTLST